jgi:hypothetical protein
MMMTKRDLEILKFINDFGFCEMPQIERQFSLKKPRSYQVVKRLINAGLLMHEYILHKQHGIYRLTKLGEKWTDFPALKFVSLGGYSHQLKVIDVYQQLMQHYPDAFWMSERRLKQDKFSTGRWRRRYGHIADGMLLFPDGKRIAIEVELTMKTKDRLNKIVKSYGANFDIKEVWYFCAKEITHKVKKEIANKAHVRVFELTGQVL